MKTATMTILIVLALGLPLMGDFLGCYYMITNSSTWCEPLLASLHS